MKRPRTLARALAAELDTPYRQVGQGSYSTSVPLIALPPRRPRPEGLHSQGPTTHSYLSVRMDHERKRMAVVIAHALGVSLSDWIRDRVNGELIEPNLHMFSKAKDVDLG